jgi:tetratricopeptide (TPR) repeat protein
MYLRLNRLDEARALSDATLSRFPNIVFTRFIVACRQGDRGRMAELLKKGREAKALDVLLGAFHCAIRDGRFAEARNLRAEPGLGARGLVEMAFAEWRLGDRARGKAMALEASQVPPEAALPVRVMPLLAEVGESDKARRLMAHRVADQPKDTLLNGVWVPLTESILALAENKPDVAIEAIRPAERYQRRWPEVTFQRGVAYMRGGNLPSAIAEFKRLTDAEPTWPPGSSVYPAAWLALARAHVAAGDHVAARRAYEQFLDLWKHADPNLTAYIDARRELAALK